MKYPNEFEGAAAFLLLRTKVLPNLNRAELIRQVIRAQTAIVLIENFVDIEQEIVDSYSNNELISGLAFICCQRIADRSQRERENTTNSQK